MALCFYLATKVRYKLGIEMHGECSSVSANVDIVSGWWHRVREAILPTFRRALLSPSSRLIDCLPVCITRHNFYNFSTVYLACFKLSGPSCKVVVRFVQKRFFFVTFIVGLRVQYSILQARKVCFFLTTGALYY